MGDLFTSGYRKIGFWNSPERSGIGKLWDFDVMCCQGEKSKGMSSHKVWQFYGNRYRKTFF